MQRQNKTGSYLLTMMAVVAAVLSGSGCVLAQTLADKDKAVPTTDPQQPNTPADRGNSVTLTVGVDKTTVVVGRPLKMTLTVKNTTRKPVTLNFNSGQKYDFILREGAKPDGKIVWQWSRGHMFAQMMSSQTLEPGKSLTFTDTYPPKPEAGHTNEALKAGTYTLTGILATFPLNKRPTAMTRVIVK